MSREHHFEHFVSGGAATAGPGREKPGAGLPSCDAYCAAPATHLATQQGSARDGAPLHETKEPAETTGCFRGLFGTYAVYQNGRNGGDRIRTCDLEVMSLASYRAAPPRDMLFAFHPGPTRKSDRPMRTTPS